MPSQGEPKSAALQQSPECKSPTLPEYLEVHEVSSLGAAAPNRQTKLLTLEQSALRSSTRQKVVEMKHLLRNRLRNLRNRLRNRLRNPKQKSLQNPPPLQGEDLYFPEGLLLWTLSPQRISPFPFPLCLVQVQYSTEQYSLYQGF